MCLKIKIWNTCLSFKAQRHRVTDCCWAKMLHHWALPLTHNLGTSVILVFQKWGGEVQKVTQHLTGKIFCSYIFIVCSKLQASLIQLEIQTKLTCNPLESEQGFNRSLFQSRRPSINSHKPWNLQRGCLVNTEAMCPADLWITYYIGMTGWIIGNTVRTSFSLLKQMFISDTDLVITFWNVGFISCIKVWLGLVLVCRRVENILLLTIFGHWADRVIFPAGMSGCSGEFFSALVWGLTPLAFALKIFGFNGLLLFKPKMAAHSHYGVLIETKDSRSLTSHAWEFS